MKNNTFMLYKELSDDSLYGLILLKDGKMNKDSFSVIVENFDNGRIENFMQLAKKGLVRYDKTKYEHTFKITERGLLLLRQNFHRIYDKVFKGSMKYYLQSRAYTDFLKWNK